MEEVQSYIKMGTVNEDGSITVEVSEGMKECLQRRNLKEKPLNIHVCLTDEHYDNIRKQK